MNKELLEGERERIVRIIVEGKKTEYWSLLKGYIKQWREEESIYLDSFKVRGIKSEKDREIYNRIVDRIEFLERLLIINETIIDYNRSLLQRMKVKTEQIFRKAESFVTNGK